MWNQRQNITAVSQDLSAFVRFMVCRFLDPEMKFVLLLDHMHAVAEFLCWWKIGNDDTVQLC